MDHEIAHRMAYPSTYQAVVFNSQLHRRLRLFRSRLHFSRARPSQEKLVRSNFRSSRFMLAKRVATSIRSRFVKHYAFRKPVYTRRLDLLPSPTRPIRFKKVKRALRGRNRILAHMRAPRKE